MKSKNFIVQMVRDEDPLNPREMCDSPSHMVCSHRNYTFGGGVNDGEGAIGAAFDSSYEAASDRHLMWVFSEFIENTKAADTEVFQGWYTLEGGCFARDRDGQENWEQESIPDELREAIVLWAEENLAILPLHLYEH